MKSSKAFLEFLIFGEIMLGNTVEETYKFLKEMGRGYRKSKFLEDYKRVKEGKRIKRGKK